jgi:hypothetical protein
MARKAPAWFWETYGEALVIAGKCNEAIPKYHEALELGAKGLSAGEAHLGLAICYDAVGRDDEARVEIKAAVEVAPDLTVSFLRDFQTYTDQAYEERWLATLQRLGLPEG